MITYEKEIKRKFFQKKTLSVIYATLGIAFVGLAFKQEGAFMKIILLLVGLLAIYFGASELIYTIKEEKEYLEALKLVETTEIASTIKQKVQEPKQEEELSFTEEEEKALENKIVDPKKKSKKTKK